MGLSVKRFEFGKDESRWNDFLNHAKNQTFLFNRKFMDYHKDRFTDHSLMIFDEKENLIACFPANEKDHTTIASHSGLTYGAFIVDRKLKLPIIISVFKEILKYFFNKGFKKIYYKAFPRIYNTIPADEIDYCLFIAEARLWRRDTAIVVNQHDRIKYSGNIKREARNASKKGFYVEQSTDYSTFWDNLLVPNLIARFGVKPVHSKNEIQLLA